MHPLQNKRDHDGETNLRGHRAQPRQNRRGHARPGNERAARQEAGECPYRDARAEREHAELCLWRRQRARKLEQHDSDTDKSGVARQGREHGGALPLRGRHGAQHRGGGKSRDHHEKRDDTKDVAPSPLLGDVAGDSGTDQRRQDPSQ